MLQNLWLNTQLHATSWYQFGVSDAWKRFIDGVEGFFADGKGGGGMYAALTAIGWMLVVIGLAFAALSFFIHHFNQQSRLPHWGICLTIAIVGGLLIKPEADFKWIQSVGEWIQSLLAGGN